jgi:hypothetical protein
MGQVAQVAAVVAAFCAVVTLVIALREHRKG